MRIKKITTNFVDCSGDYIEIYIDLDRHAIFDDGNTLNSSLGKISQTEIRQIAKENEVILFNGVLSISYSKRKKNFKEQARKILQTIKEINRRI